MADKQITVAVPEERVPEFYAWFADFLTAEPGTAASSERGRHGHRGRRHRSDASAWSATTPTRPLGSITSFAPPARELFDLLLDAPGERFGGETIATRLGLEKEPTASRGSSPGRAATRATSTASSRSTPKAERTGAPTTTSTPTPQRSSRPPGNSQTRSRAEATNPRRTLTGPPPLSDPRKSAQGSAR